MMYAWNDGTYLAHHGILGQKWGVRRFQNPDGSYTDEGLKRYGIKENASNRKIKKALKQSGNKNWNTVGARYEKDLLKNKDLNSIESQRKQLWKDANVAYAQEYNKYAKAAGAKTVNEKTFDFYEAFNKKLLDSDLEDKIWEQIGKPGNKLTEILNKNDELIKARSKIERDIALKYIDSFNEARLKDLNYYGSKEGGERLLKRYGGAKISNSASIDFNGRTFNFGSMYSPDDYFERLTSDVFFDL